MAAYTYADDWYVLADRFTIEPDAEPAAANDLPIPATEPPNDDLPDPEPEASPGEAEALLKQPRRPRRDDLPVTELASWFGVARVLLNLDEVIHRG